MVPSWTETLLKAGVEVVGRTRFCIHPAGQVATIPVVGGTKDINWEKVASLNADLILLDEEENPKKMADEAPLRYLATHVRSITDVGYWCESLSQSLRAPALMTISKRWRQCGQGLARRENLYDLPGVCQWINQPDLSRQKNLTQFIYLIWQKPWMAVSSQTFIGSIFKNLGYGSLMASLPQGLYPKINLEDYAPANTVLLFSTEPFHFANRLEQLKALPFSSALVDGEKYSWFGIRSLEFVEHARAHLG